MARVAGPLRRCRTCCTDVAPVMTVETLGLRTHHARASCASEQPSSCAERGGREGG